MRQSIVWAIFLMVVAVGLLACGGGGNSSSTGGAISDITSPSIPTNLGVTAASSGQLDIFWTASSDNVGVAGYKIYRNGVFLKTVSTTSSSDTGLSTSTQYCYTVSAYDSANNESSQTASKCATTTNTFFDKTLLLRGQWHFVYTIISTFTDDYTLSTISSDTNSQGGYWIYGTDQYGGAVNATYWPTDGNWALLDPGTIIDKFYAFYTNGSTILANSCYYQITISTGAWSQCFSLSGNKTSTAYAPSLKTYLSPIMRTDEQLLIENTTSFSIDEETKAKYLQLRDMNKSLSNEVN